MNMKELEEKVLSLDCQERAQLAARLLLSLEESTESDVEQLWLDEAERRLEDHRKGAVRAIPAPEVFARVLEEIK